MTKEKEVAEKQYPPKMGYWKTMKEMTRVSVLDTGFHALMAILLITGLMIDLLGPWLGGWLLLIRSIIHGYLGAIFVIVFILYIVHVVYSRKMRTVLTATNYVDFVFYIILIITGVTIASVNKPWVDWFPWLAGVLAPVARLAPTLHVAITYIWILFSTVFPGGLLHGLASVYLISHLKKKSRLQGH